LRGTTWTPLATDGVIQHPPGSLALATMLASEAAS
jgi:hypothetical protein